MAACIINEELPQIAIVNCCGRSHSHSHTWLSLRACQRRLPETVFIGSLWYYRLYAITEKGEVPLAIFTR